MAEPEVRVLFGGGCQQVFPSEAAAKEATRHLAKDDYLILVIERPTLFESDEFEDV